MPERRSSPGYEASRYLRMALALAFSLAILAAHPWSSAAADEFKFNPPAGIPADLWAYFVPRNNALTPAKVELGRRLFFDTRLSADGSISCSTCHDPHLAFTDGKQTAQGIGGRHGARNTPTVLNAMFNSSLFWDGRADSLEAQAIEPMVNPDEMGNQNHDQVVKRLAAVLDYVDQFNRAFAGPVTIGEIAQAIAAYERTLVSAGSPFDRFQAGDRNALSEAAQRGLNLFRGKARCSVCHSLNASFPFLTDGNYRNTGVAANFAGFGGVASAATMNDPLKLMPALDQRSKSELGRFVVSRDALDIGSFRTPSLRNIELTAPYFHDGSAATLADVVRYYVRGGNANASRDWELQPIDLDSGEQRDLIEFLRSLTSDEARRQTSLSTRP